jgi:hypothetical protein
MAKITRNMLKGIVKECLVELLAEGLGSPEVILESKHRTTKPNQKKSRSMFDQMDKAFKQKLPKDNFNEAVNSAAQIATEDPVLQGILADTARTTLQDQMQHESRMPSIPTTQSGVEYTQSSISSPISSGGGAGLDINSLFGEATKNWGEVLDRTGAKNLP